MVVFIFFIVSMCKRNLGLDFLLLIIFMLFSIASRVFDVASGNEMVFFVILILFRFQNYVLLQKIDISKYPITRFHFILPNY